MFITKSGTKKYNSFRICPQEDYVIVQLINGDQQFRLTKNK